MSSFIVQKKTIDRICDAVLRNDNYKHEIGLPYVHNNISGFGQALWNLNRLATGYRYRESIKFEKYKYEPAIANKYQVLKSIKGFLYQCSEGNYLKNPLYLKMENLMQYIAMEIISGMKEYDIAEWG